MSRLPESLLSTPNSAAKFYPHMRRAISFSSAPTALAYGGRGELGVPEWSPFRSL